MRRKFDFDYYVFVAAASAVYVGCSAVCYVVRTLDFFPFLAFALALSAYSQSFSFRSSVVHSLVVLCVYKFFFRFFHLVWLDS